MPEPSASSFGQIHDAPSAPNAPRQAANFTGWLGLITLSVSIALVWSGRLGWLGGSVSLVVFLTGSLLVLRSLPAAQQQYGTANRLTQLRLAMAALLCGLVLERIAGVAAPATETAQWWIVAFAAVAAALDAVDGPLARRQGLANALGARFDMEVDAFFLLILSLLAWQWQRLGAWIVLAGAMRYAFIAAAWRWPWLGRPLAPSSRRQTVCVIQIVGLLIALVPGIGTPWTTLAGGIGLGLLVWSFAIDITWAWRARS